MRITASIVLAASAPLGALAAPNPIFTSLRSLIRQASELTSLDLGLLSGPVQRIVGGQQQHVRQWMHDGRTMIEQAGVVCKSSHCAAASSMDIDEPMTSTWASSCRRTGQSQCTSGSQSQVTLPQTLRPTCQAIFWLS